MPPPSWVPPSGSRDGERVAGGSPGQTERQHGGVGAGGAPWTMRLTSDLEIWLLPSTTSQMYFPVSSRVTVLKWMLVDVNWTRFL